METAGLKLPFPFPLAPATEEAGWAAPGEATLGAAPIAAAEAGAATVCTGRLGVINCAASVLTSGGEADDAASAARTLVKVCPGDRAALCGAAGAAVGRTGELTVIDTWQRKQRTHNRIMSVTCAD